jgi:hypothetical protein
MYEQKQYKINSDLVYRQEDKNFFSLSKMEIYQLDEISYKILENLVGESFSYDEFVEEYMKIENIDPDYCNEFFQYLQELKIVKQDI